MSVHPPRRRQLVPPTPEEAQSRADEAAAWRAELKRRDAELRPARLAAVRAGPPLRDPDAAADCHCGCHPKPADAEQHDGGRSCGCQLTPEERHLAVKEFTAQLSSLGLDDGIRSGEAELAQRAAELGVSATWRLVAAPFVITGNVDGRGFYLRERHGSYRVTIAPDDDPGADPWELPAERLTLDIAGGDDDDLTDPGGGCDVAHALTVAVHAVRTYLTRQRCTHQRPTDPRHLYCAWCGRAARRSRPVGPDTVAGHRRATADTRRVNQNHNTKWTDQL